VGPRGLDPTAKLRHRRLWCDPGFAVRSAQKQFFKVLLRLAQWARFTHLKSLFEVHFEETHRLVKRSACFRELGVAARRSPAKA
jgi:ferritin-like metal-binding protein YciE